MKTLQTEAWQDGCAGFGTWSLGFTTRLDYVNATVRSSECFCASERVCFLRCLLVVRPGCAFIEMFVTLFALDLSQSTSTSHSPGSPEENSSVSSFCLSKNIKHLNQWAFISYLIFFLRCRAAASSLKTQRRRGRERERELKKNTAVLFLLFLHSSRLVNYRRGKVKSTWKPLR